MFLMSVNAVDCTGLNPTQINSLKNNGVKYVGRYLSHAEWKGLNVGEVANIKAAGLDIFSIYESNPTSASYFSAAKGKSDALDAIALAKSLGQPENSVIYFTVDYDAQAGDLPAILAYFQNVRANLNGYKTGAYGSYTVLNYLHQNNAADYWFQTLAWSSGQHCSFLNIYQYQIDKTNWNNTGVNVDLDNLEKSDIGAWGQNIAKAAVTVTIQEVPNSEYVGKTLTSKVDGLWYYNTPKWDTCDGTSNKGDSWIITKEILCNGGRMVLCHDGKYRTASADYVEVTPYPSDWPFSVNIDGLTYKQAQDIVIYIQQNYKDSKPQGIAK
jgi:hypothetical protein